MRKTITLVFAAAVTAAALAMAAASAWQRADVELDRWLLASVSCAIVAAVHLLPALLRRSLIVWPVWMLCFLAAMYSHAGFFTSAGQGAAEVRAAASVHAKSVQERREAIKQTLTTIRARPAATVAQQLARARTPERVQALTIELEEAKRAAKLRDELVSLAQVSSITAVTDPVTARVVVVTGWSAEAVTLAVNVALAALLELLGMLLWLEALRTTKDESSSASQDPESVQVVPAQLPSELQRLRLAVERGECAPKVSEIRQYLSCGQTRAMQLRRELLASADP